MNTPSREPVPAITEADATGEIARLYADIRSSLGAPVVNLIWRHFATLPGGLAWAWESVRPLYQDGSINAQAAALRANLRVPVPGNLSDQALQAAGLDGEDLTTISMILSSYERTNSMNIIALGALLASIEGRTGTLDAQAMAQEDAASLEGEMPKPLALSEMPADVRDLVQRLHGIGPADDIVPTMYRHMSHWPGFLGLVYDLLAPLDTDAQLSHAVEETLKESRERAAALVPGLAMPSTTPDPTTVRHIQDRLTQFIDGPLAKMVTLVAIVRVAMPRSNG